MLFISSEKKEQYLNLSIDVILYMALSFNFEFEFVFNVIYMVVHCENPLTQNWKAFNSCMAACTPQYNLYGIRLKLIFLVRTCFDVLYDVNFQFVRTMPGQRLLFEYGISDFFFKRESLFPHHQSFRLRMLFCVIFYSAISNFASEKERFYISFRFYVARNISAECYIDVDNINYVQDIVACYITQT